MYNLDMIISVGYRINSKRGVKFRQWANRVLKEYMLNGYSVNRRFETIEQRLTAAEQARYRRFSHHLHTSTEPATAVRCAAT